jgi:radical SAM C-methyltransferase
MKVNDWEELAEWLGREGLECYAELIWGAPGETVDSFMAGYDKLSQHVSRIAVYPLHLLPNTDYSEKKSDYGIISVRGDHDDFEYILSHNTMTFADNQLMKRFLFWTRVMAENAILRGAWVGIRELGGMTQSQVLKNLDSWVHETDDPAALPLRTCVAEAASSDTAYGDAIKYLFGYPEARDLLQRWWNEALRPSFPEGNVSVLDDIFKYDLLTQPYYHHPDAGPAPKRLESVSIRGEAYLKRTGITMNHDIPAVLAALRAGNKLTDLVPSKHSIDLYYREGAENFIGSTNHEEIVHFVGMTLDEVERAAALRAKKAEAAQAIGGEEGIALRLSENAGYAQ